MEFSIPSLLVLNKTRFEINPKFVAEFNGLLSLEPILENGSIMTPFSFIKGKTILKNLLTISWPANWPFGL